MKNPIRHSRPGFTLVELLVVYYDGSSGTVSPADIREIDKKGGANHPFWKANAP